MSELSKWDHRFLKIAYEVASWSKDPGTKVGAVLVSDRRIISQGYNGFPQGIDDSPERYSNRETKLAYTVHAEINAILNAAKNGSKTNESTLYVTFSPCVGCASSVIQSGVKTVVCPDVITSPARWKDNFLLGQSMLKESGVNVLTFFPSSHV